MRENRNRDDALRATGPGDDTRGGLPPLGEMLAGEELCVRRYIIYFCNYADETSMRTCSFEVVGASLPVSSKSGTVNKFPLLPLLE